MPDVVAPRYPSIVLSGNSRLAAQWIPFAKQQARSLKPNQSKVLAPTKTTRIHLQRVGRRVSARISASFTPIYFCTGYVGGVSYIYGTDRYLQLFEPVYTSGTALPYVQLGGFTGGIALTLSYPTIPGHTVPTQNIQFGFPLKETLALGAKLSESGMADSFVYDTIASNKGVLPVTLLKSVGSNATDIQTQNTLDNGKTWQTTKITADAFYTSSTNYLTHSFQRGNATKDGSVFFFMTTDNSGTLNQSAYLSTDSGKTFQQNNGLLSLQPNADPIPFVCTRGDGVQLFTSRSGSTVTIYHSSNQGTTLSAMVQVPGISSIHKMGTYGKTGVYMQVTNSSDGLIYLILSDDGGNTWYSEQALSSVFGAPLGIVQNLNEYDISAPTRFALVVFVTGLGYVLYSSADKSKSWRRGPLIFGTTQALETQQFVNQFQQIEVVGNQVEPLQ